MPQWRGSRKTARFPARNLYRNTMRQPQWRGSRKTARFAGNRGQWIKRQAAAMEGQSEDCPFRTPGGSPQQVPRAAMEGQSEDCPFPEGAPWHWTIDDKPQWRGSRKTARFVPPLRLGLARLPPPQWRGSRKTARFTSTALPRASDDPPQWRGSRKTARFLSTLTISGGDKDAAMEGQSEDCPFPHVVLILLHVLGSRNGGAVGRLPVSRRRRLAPRSWRRAPQWRGSRKTARFTGRLANAVRPVPAAMEGQSEDCPFRVRPETR